MSAAFDSGAMIRGGAGCEVAAGGGAGAAPHPASPLALRVGGEELIA